MQLTTLLLLLASVCCASAINCYKGGNGYKDEELCDKVKDTCSTTTYEYKSNGKITYDTKWTCASKEECEEWTTTAIEKKYPYRNHCCSADYCNDIANLYTEEYDHLYP